MKTDFQNTHIGILGGGQLGLMLIQAAADLHVKCHILDADSHAPCRDFASSFTQGSYEDFDTVVAFGRDKGVVTIEFEHVNADALEKLESMGVVVAPSSAVIRLVQDKGKQKLFYRENNIPTADFILINGQEELDQHISFLPAVQKLRQFGYDGKGVKVLRQPRDFDDAFDQPSVLEKLVRVDKELSVIVARNSSGKMSSFPPAELVFDPQANLVDYLICPAEIPMEVRYKAENIARQLAESLNLVGLLAVEFFLAKNGELLVNEIAPRPHNSGHHTIEGCMTSQFSQHIRAILNLPFGSTKPVMPSGMFNLLGSKGEEGAARLYGSDVLFKTENVFLHYYGKAVTKPFRKMGHVTVLNEDPSRVRRLVTDLKRKVRVGI